MNKLEWALHHAKEGFWVFRILEDGKQPRYKGWQEEATRDPKKIRKLWSGRNEQCNVGAFTSKFKNKALIVVDVDVKEGRDGNVSLTQLDFEGRDMPDTLENITASKGRHLIYQSPNPVKQGANVIGDGLDIRSRGGYIVMAGSTIDELPYTLGGSDEVSEAPDWLYEKLHRATNNASAVKVDASKIDPERARERAEQYLDTARLPDEGERNDTTFKVTCELKDRGVTQDVCQELMDEWNTYLDDPIDQDELEVIIGSAYKTGQNDIGSNAAEAIFSEVEVVVPEEEKADAKLHPYDEMNKEYALVLAGGAHHILWETTDAHGKFKLEHLNEQSFHKYHCHRSTEVPTAKGSKLVHLSKEWISSKKCRRYKGLVFEPGAPASKDYYNLWRGFDVDPLPYVQANEAQQKGFDAFIEHTFENVCRQDEECFKYLMDYAAHMIQRPMEKPSVMVVFKGCKGTGKNVWLETLFSLIESHSLIADNRRYLIGNFNSHLEGKLAIGLDEGFWAGQKNEEGALKGLISGAEILIERKGMEPYSVKNNIRPFVLSNEHWVVPASADERRYFVLDVGDGRRRDTEFFADLVRRMRKEGGNKLFLEYLMQRDISDFNPHSAPETKALTDQKHASLEPFEGWWFNCLSEGELLGSSMTLVDFEKIHCSQFRNAFAQYANSRHIRSRLPDDRQIGMILSRVAASLTKRQIRQGGEVDYFYTSEGLTTLRSDWEEYIGSKVEWPTLNLGEIECLT